MKRGWVVGLGLGAAVATSALEADAFCGFYLSGADTKLFNNATMVVLMRDGIRTVLSMQNNYEGPPQDFALVVPVPVVLQESNVKTLPREVFTHIDQLAAPRLVEYWERDPCYEPETSWWPDFRERKEASQANDSAASRSSDLGVTVEAKFEVGEYQILILSAQNSSGLDTYLRENKYKIPEGAEPVLRPYVESGMKFFVAKVDVEKVKFEKRDGKDMAMLSPLRFHYDSEAFSLPVRLGLLNSGGKQDLIVHILAPNKRYEVANYPNVTIPTNLDVDESARDKFGSFYAALFDRTVEQNPRAVVTEYAWDASTCDPCPGPAMQPGEFMTLGADVLEERAGTQAERSSQRVGFTLTRLHARYGKDSLGEDLVFKEAPPITGGREVGSGAGGPLERGSTTTAGFNNFQGRYAIRHPWTGAISCSEPKRGVWGGPPEGKKSPGTRPALDLAFVARDGSLEGFLKQDVPELGIAGLGPGLHDPQTLKEKYPGTKSGCQCRTPDNGPASGFGQPLWGALLALALLRRRQRRR